jgi:hypothetical protein
MLKRFFNVNQNKKKNLLFFLPFFLNRKIVTILLSYIIIQ